MHISQTIVTKSEISELELRVNEGIIEDSQYIFRVTAHNKAGPSEPSPPSQQITAKDPWSEIYKCLCPFHLR